MKYLATFDGASGNELNGVKAAAVKGCIGALKSPIVSFTEQVMQIACSGRVWWVKRFVRLSVRPSIRLGLQIPVTGVSCIASRFNRNSTPRDACDFFGT